MTIGEAIRSIRRRKGLSQRDLADRMGITHSLIGQYERGEKNPKPATIARIADALDVSSYEIDPTAITPKNSLDIIQKQLNYKFRNISSNDPDEMLTYYELLFVFEMLNKKAQTSAIDYLEDLAHDNENLKDLWKGIYDEDKASIIEAEIMQQIRAGAQGEEEA